MSSSWRSSLPSVGPFGAFFFKSHFSACCQLPCSNHFFQSVVHLSARQFVRPSSFYARSNYISLKSSSQRLLPFVDLFNVRPPVRSVCFIISAPMLSNYWFSFLDRFELDISASMSTFSDRLYGPMSDGFRPVCQESFAAVASTRLFDWTGRRVSERAFRMAALEFGGKFTCASA